MCGITAILNVKEQSYTLRDKALKMSQKIRHRGPDWSGIYCGGSAILAHERLSIVDPESGGQPLFTPDRKQVLAVNGEIYKKSVVALQDSISFKQAVTARSFLHYIMRKALISWKTSAASLPLYSTMKPLMSFSLHVIPLA